MIHCNNDKCEHNENQICILANTYYINGLCVSCRNKSKGTNYKNLMRVDNPNCIRSGGKWKNRI
jgi:hypothetical protein